MSKIFELEVPEGNTSCCSCPFIHNKYSCLYLSESKLCSQYDFLKAKISEAPNKEIKCFHTEVTNEEMVNLLLQFPKDAVVAVECCNPRTMKYNKDDNTIRID
jgi:hypothetical protein